MEAKKFNIDLTKLTELEFDGIDYKDYPDFCDAFLSSAYYIDRELTEDELDYINDYENSFISENIFDYIF